MTPLPPSFFSNSPPRKQPKLEHAFLCIRLYAETSRFGMLVQNLWTLQQPQRFVGLCRSTAYKQELAALAVWRRKAGSKGAGLKFFRLEIMCNFLAF
jgi:hypothetical protein